MTVPPLSRVLLLSCALLMVPSPPGFPQAVRQKTDFAKHPFFKLLIGNWKSEGVLKNADGKEVRIIEEWTGTAAAEGGFTIEGRRLIDGDKQEYSWTFTHNPATGLYEAVHSVATKEAENRRFEASISEVDLTMELRLVGDGGSSLTIKDSFPSPDHDKLESSVQMTGSGGETNLSGKLVHSRQKKT